MWQNVTVASASIGGSMLSSHLPADETVARQFGDPKVAQSLQSHSRQLQVLAAEE